MKKRCNLFDYTPAAGEKNTLPSMTVPGRSMTIKEILARFTSGMLSPEDLRPAYYDDPNGDNVEFDDPTDDLLYDGSTDLTQIQAAQEDALSRLEMSKEQQEPPIVVKDDAEERSDEKEV